MRSPKADLTAGLTSSAPRTCIEEMVRKANSGETSSAMPTAGAKNLDMKCLTGGLYGFQVVARVTPESKLQLMPSDRLLHRIAVAVELIANGYVLNKISSIGIKIPPARGDRFAPGLRIRG